MWPFRSRLQSRLEFIESYTWPPGLRERFAREHAQLSPAQTEQIFGALKGYFRLCARANGRMVAMPSHAVDEAWHLFLLWTREYAEFCQGAFGRFLHHAPHTALDLAIVREGEDRAWELACRDDGLDPLFTRRLPRLFALDQALGVPGTTQHDPARYQKRLRQQRNSRSAARRGQATGGSCGSSGGDGASSGHNSCGDSGDSGGCDSGSSCGGSSCGGGGCGGS
jgi:hypothetical protein